MKKRIFVISAVIFLILIIAAVYKYKLPADSSAPQLSGHKNKPETSSLDLLDVSPLLNGFSPKYKPVKEGVFQLDEKPRYVLAGPLPHLFSFSVSVPEDARLEFSLGAKYQKESSIDSEAMCIVKINIKGGQEETIFEKDINIYAAKSDNLWNDISVDLKRFGGKDAVVTFISESGGSTSSPDARIGWADIKVISGDQRSAQAKEVPLRKNLLIVTLDDVRYDKIGFNGSKTTATPNIDKLADESVAFDNAFSAAPWTLPSLTSLFSSLYFHQHEAGMATNLVRKRVKMLAEIMKKAGYKTRGFTGIQSYANPKFGFFDGFDSMSRKSDEDNIADIRSWLKQNGDNPFFIWIHFDGAHHPFNAPEPFFRKAGSYKGPLNVDNAHKLSRLHLKGRFTFQKEDVGRLIDLYDGMVDYTDYKFGKLLDVLKESKVFDKTLIVLTADHGEQLLGEHDHGLVDHGCSVYDELLHVPLLIRFPGRDIKPARVNELVSLIDVMPTILSYFSVPQNNLQISGLNLMPLIKSPEHALKREFITAEEGNRFYITFRSKKWKYTFVDLKMMANFQHYPEGFISRQNEMLFNIEEDPYEQVNVASEHPKLIKVMREKVIKVIQEYGTSKGRTGTLENDEETKEQLKALGYL